MCCLRMFYLVIYQTALFNRILVFFIFFIFCTILDNIVGLHIISMQINNLQMFVSHCVTILYQKLTKLRPQNQGWYRSGTSVYRYTPNGDGWNVAHRSKCVL